MAIGDVRELGHGRLLVDLGFRDHEGLIAGYLLPGPDSGWYLVETGPATSHPALERGLARAGIAPGEVRRVFVTHIHLDHAGGLGGISKLFPNAEFYAHRAGVAHLIDPTRLVASARRAWGPAADQLWGPVSPVPASRLHALEGGEQFPLRDGRLEAVPTPGHAPHHLAYFDTGASAVMTGDSAGVQLAGNFRARPALPPPDLDLELLFGSLARMEALRPRALWYAHFGPSTGSTDLETYRVAVGEWRDAALSVARETPDVAAIAARLKALEESAARSAGTRLPVEDSGQLISGYEMAAMGLLRYFRTHRLIAE